MTSVRDGMNLVSHEYVSLLKNRWIKKIGIEETRPRSRASSSKDDDDVLQPFVKEGPGALVLSEFAGSAQSLSGAIRVNPWNTDELARAIDAHTHESGAGAAVGEAAPLRLHEHGVVLGAQFRRRVPRRARAPSFITKIAEAAGRPRPAGLPAGLLVD